MVIPNGEILFRFALPAAFPQDQTEIPSSVFNDSDLSCDWERHRSDPATSPHVAVGKSVVISILVCDDIKKPGNARGPQKEWEQEVIHDPWEEDDPPFSPNLSHSLVRGRKRLAVVEALRRNSTWQKLL